MGKHRQEDGISVMREASDEAVTAIRPRVLQIFATMRALGARFYREYITVNIALRRDGVCEATMPAGVHVQGADGSVAPGALATLADIALGTSSRRLVPRGHRMATVGLTMQFAPEAKLAGNIQARAEVVSATAHMTVSQCRLTDDVGDLVALATGTFAIRPVPEGTPWLPYSQDSKIAASSLPPVASEDLNDIEQRLLGRVEHSLKSPGPDGPFASFLGIEWLSRGDGEPSGVWPLGPHLWNRVDHVQGGAIFGALSAAALACLPDDVRTRIVEQHVQYVRPGAGKSLRVEAKLQRRGQLLTSVQAEMTDENGDRVAGALVTLQRLSRD